ncbi:MAG: hypothetical protein JWR28_1165 [Modestobacter sp.]|nr:hypothetical protein [Modestobacter sp.]MCW2577044.1 hypothetical protein [Modestobacter sp.]MCW2618016.1 hypothetical protein [Modestobacter sp.]
MSGAGQEARTSPPTSGIRPSNNHQAEWSRSCSRATFAEKDGTRESTSTGTVPFERMRRDLDAMPEVVSASTVSGGADAMLRVVASDASHLERVVSRLRDLTYVQQTNTVLLLSNLLSRPTPLTTGHPH